MQLLFSGRAGLVFLRFLHTLYYLLLIKLNLKKINIELVVNIKCRVARITLTKPEDVTAVVTAETVAMEKLALGTESFHQVDLCVAEVAHF